VLNLDDTFAVTQNVMTHINFERVWISLRRERRKFARYFLERLRTKVSQSAKARNQRSTKGLSY